MNAAPLRLLFVVPYAPTPIRTRPHHFLRALAARGNDVTLATLWENAPERAALDDLRAAGITVHAERLTRPRIAWNLLAGLPGKAPLQVSYSWHPALAARVEQLARSGIFDAAHVEHLRGARYAILANRRLPTVWDSVDCISHLFALARQHSHDWRSRLRAWVELGRTRRHEAWLARQFARVLVTADTDKRAMDALAFPSQPGGTPLSPVTVVPNGVSLDGCDSAGEGRETATVVFSGKMSYHANVTAAVYLGKEIMPLVWRQRPDARLWIAGQAPAAAVKQLAADARVTVTGTVPDLRRYLARATVAACPMPYGAGIQNKVLEAMACATPVVSSDGAVRALAALPERDVLVAHAPVEFAAGILRLIAEPALAREIGAAGRAYVEREHNWSALAARLEEQYRKTRQLWNTQPGPR